MGALLCSLLVSLFAAPTAAAGPYRTEVMADNPQGYWRLGETGGTTAFDETSNGNQGDYENGVALGVPGAIPDSDPAAHFDGVDDQVNMGDPASGPFDFGTDDFTFEAWIRTAVNGEQIIASKQDSFGSPYWQVAVSDDSAYTGRIRAWLFDGSDSRQVFGPAVQVNDGAWHHVVVLFERSSGITIYVDKIHVFETPGAMTGSVDNAAPLLIGGRTVDYYPAFSGEIDEPALYRGLLSPGRIVAHYDAVMSGDVTPPAISIASPGQNSFVNDSTPTFSGSAGMAVGDLPAVQVKIYNGSFAFGTPVGTVATNRDSTGAWAADAWPELPVGTYTAQAEQSDAAGNSGASVPVTFDVVPAPPDSPTDPVLLAAGNIGDCESSGDERTAALLDDLPGTVATLGDNAYEHGTDEEFANCYDPTWGRHKARTFPGVGNRDYETPGAAGYFAYFGAAAGDPTKGYYSYDLHGWHLVSLNSNCNEIGGCQTGSAQEQWLRSDLANHSNECVLAYWHEPMFSSGAAGSRTRLRSLFTTLYEGGADVLLTAHDHDYERFAPQTTSGTLDVANGVTEFVVGTGGTSHYEFPPGGSVANSQVRNDNTYGVLRLRLHPAGYDWSFLAVAGSTFTDSGSRPCHHPSAGKIIVTKDAVPDDPQDFSFSAGGGLSPSGFSLDDDQDPTLPSSHTFDDVPTGSGYSVSEAPQAGWDQTGASCDDGSSPSDIDVSAGETVTCTFTNQKVFYHRPESAPSVSVALVPNFKQCGTSGSPTTGRHAPPLDVGSCTLATPTSLNARVGGAGAGALHMQVTAGDLTITGTDSDIQTPIGADYDPNPTGTPDLTTTTRMRITDLNNCGPAPCSGPYQVPATSVDIDFGPIPIECAPNGSTVVAPGSDCNFTTSASSFMPGFVATGKQAVVQLFRARVIDADNRLFQQQGIYAP